MIKPLFGHALDWKPPVSGWWLKVLMVLALPMLLAGCDGSGGGAVSGPNVQISGRVTYDFVPVAAIATGPGSPDAYLDYANTVALPARGVQVAAIDGNGRELALATADADGRYVLSVPKNTDVRVRAVARLFQAPGAGPTWDFTIRDNTSEGYKTQSASIYAMQSEPFDTGVMHLGRDLHAGSGWTGAGYGKPRTAAPFAILDQIYGAVQKVLAVDADAVFAPMVTYWSIHNRSTRGDPFLGEISTSHWQSLTDNPGLYILGKENLDTDEYDTSVIVHEWGHYFESKFSRADSIGGSHGNGDVLDMRVAFGEAWGNSLAGMIRDDPIYADTQGMRQQEPGLVMDLDIIPADEPRGWFNESSVQHVLYQMYKSPDIGFGRIYEVMVGPQKDTPAFTSLFSFGTYLRESAVAAQGQIDAWLGGIHTLNGPGLNIWGDGQGYPASLDPTFEAFVVPVYQPLVIDIPKAGVCGTNAFGDDHNKLGNFQFLRVTIGAGEAGNYVLSHELENPLAGLGDEVWLALYARGVVLAELQSKAAGYQKDEVPVTLLPGDYTVAVIDTRLADACQTITLTKK